MRYLCLVYGEEKVLAALSKGDMDALTRDSLGYDETLAKSGHLVGADALEPVRNAVSIRVRNGETSLTDGPFAETKEQLLGFVLIDARDRDEAIAIGAGIPLARLGTVEVRPIMSLNMP
jgi:hypothetical protein